MVSLYRPRRMCSRKMRLLTIATAVTLISVPGRSEPDGANRGSLLSTYEQTQQLERRAKRLAAHWREEIRLQLIRSRNQLESRTEDWMTGDDLDGAEFKARFEEALLVAKSMGMDPERLREYLEILKRAIRRADLREYDQSYAEDIPTTNVAATLSWFESNIEEAAANSAERQAFRAALYRRTSLLFMNALLEKDPYSVADRMAQLKQAIDSIQGADVLVLQAETEALIATQTLIADVASGFPIIGETIDASSLIEGSTPAGEQLDAWGKAFALLGLIPVAGDLLQVVRRSPDTIRAMSQMVVGIDNASEESLNAIARVARLDVQTLRQTSGRLAQIPEVRAATRGIGVDALTARTNRAIEASLSDPNIVGADALWQAIEKNAESQVDRLRVTLADRADALDPQVIADYVSVRSNNVAVKTLQTSDEATRIKVSKIEQKLFGTFVKTGSGDVVNVGDGLVDTATFDSMRRELKPALKLAVEASGVSEKISALQKQVGASAGDIIVSPNQLTDITSELSALKTDLAALQTSLKKEPAGRVAEGLVRTVKRRKASEGQSFAVGDSLAPDQVKIEVFNATNDLPEPGKIGTDRDATFRLVDGDGVRIDIPADFARRHYAVSLYEALNPGRTLSRTDADGLTTALTFTRQMDHAITDGLDAEAYRLYDGQLSSILGDEARTKPATLTAADVESLQRTFEFKGFHLLIPVPGNPAQTQINRVEAMRQIRKQFDNLVVPRLIQDGQALAHVLPAKTLVSYQLLKRVESKDISPAQAEAGLRSMGLTLEQAFVLMAEAINFGVRRK